MVLINPESFKPTPTEVKRTSGNSGSSKPGIDDKLLRRYSSITAELKSNDNLSDADRDYLKEQQGWIVSQLEAGADAAGGTNRSNSWFRNAIGYLGIGVNAASRGVFNVMQLTSPDEIADQEAADKFRDGGSFVDRYFRPENFRTFGELVQADVGDKGNEAFASIPLPFTDSTVDLTGNRIMGFLGDLILDPLNLVGGGTVKAAGKTRRGLSAISIADNVVDLADDVALDAAARIYARRTLAAVDSKTLKSLGVTEGVTIGSYLTARKSFGVAVPGTAAPARVIGSASGRAKKFLRDSRVGRAFLEGRKADEVYLAARAYDKMPTAEMLDAFRTTVFKADAVEDLKPVANAWRKAMKSTFRSTMTEYGDGVEAAYRRNSDEIRSFMENPTAQAAFLRGPVDEALSWTASTGEVVPLAPLFETLEHVRDSLIGSGASFDLLGTRAADVGVSGRWANARLGYFPRNQALDGVRKPTIGKPNSVRDAVADIMKKRRFRPGEFLFDEQLVDEGLRAGGVASNTVSVDQVREVLLRNMQNPNFTWPDDVVDQMDAFIFSSGQAHALSRLGQQAVAAGLGLDLTEMAVPFKDPLLTQNFVLHALGAMKRSKRGEDVLLFASSSIEDILQDPVHHMDYLNKAIQSLRTYRPAGATRGKKTIDLGNGVVMPFPEYYDQVVDRLIVLAEDARKNVALALSSQDPHMSKVFATLAQAQGRRLGNMKYGVQALTPDQFNTAIAKMTDIEAHRLGQLLADGDALLADLAVEVGLENGGRVLGGSTLVSDELARTLLQRDRIDFRDPEMKSFIDDFTSWWKRLATLSPAFNLRNHISAMVMEYAAGHNMRDIRTFTRMYIDAKAGKRISGPGSEYVREIITRGDIAVMETTRFDDARVSGRVARVMYFGDNPVGRAFQEGSERLSRATDKVSEGFDRGAAATVAAVGSQKVTADLRVEEVIRGAHLFAELRRGASYESARRSMYKFHFDYADLSKLDETMKKFVPFWVFMSRNIPLQIELLYRRPGLFNDITRYDRESKEKYGYDIAPEWTNSMMTLYLEDGRTYISPDVGLNDLYDLDNAFSTGSPFSPLISSSSPLAKVGYAMVQGQHPDYDGEIKNTSTSPLANFEVKPGDVLYEKLNRLGFGLTADEDGTIRPNAPAIYALRTLNPIYDRLVRFTDGDDEKAANAYIGFLFGGFRELTDGQLVSGAYSVDEKLEEYLKRTGKLPVED